MFTRILTFAIHKRCTGKTTIAVNLAQALFLRLTAGASSLIDFDPQANATSA